MKKFISVFLAVALVAVACCVFASAEDTNLALGKSYTIDGYDYDASVENYVDNETHSKLTDVLLKMLLLGMLARLLSAFPVRKKKPLRKSITV